MARKKYRLSVPAEIYFTVEADTDSEAVEKGKRVAFDEWENGESLLHGDDDEHSAMVYYDQQSASDPHVNWMEEIEG